MKFPTGSIVCDPLWANVLKELVIGSMALLTYKRLSPVLKVRRG